MGGKSVGGGGGGGGGGGSCVGFFLVSILIAVTTGGRISASRNMSMKGFIMNVWSWNRFIKYPVISKFYVTTSLSEVFV
jgi:hypothetical protein